jgi:hypothetical protein
MNPETMEISYQFVNYGEDINPEIGTLVLDVGMKTVPGVIDHHQPSAEVECAASLVTKHPHLVLDHFKKKGMPENKEEALKLKIITHRLPDFDALSSIFLAIRLLITGRVDLHMEKISSYARLVDSASLPKKIDLTSTPYSILRALFSGIKKEKEEINLERVKEGLKFMNFLHSKSEEGYEILENRALFSGIDRYERAMRKAENDYFNYLLDVSKGDKFILFLPLAQGSGRKKVSGLVIKNPRSFLLKEWARRDRENSPLAEGFSLLLTNFGNKRYILGVDQEMGVNLKGLGDLLNRKEAEKRAQEARPPAFRWYDGNCPFFNFRIVDSPQDVTSLSHEEVVEILLSFGRKEEG